MFIRSLHKELQELAVSNLKEDPRRIEDDLKIILDWLQENRHLGIKTDSQWLLSFLRGCQFDLDLVKQKLSVFSTMKYDLPDVFNNRDPFLPEIQDMLALGICLPLPKTSNPSASRIILCRGAEFVDPRIPIEVGLKLLSMIGDILLREDDNFVIAGAHAFADSKGVTFRHALNVSPMLAKKLYGFFINAYAVKPQGVHVINAPSIVHFTFNVLKYIASSEHINMVHFYHNNESEELYESIPLSILPLEYGGDGGSIPDLTAEWKQKVESYRNWFLED